MVAAPPAPRPGAPAPRGTTARDGAVTRATVARFSPGWTVTERVDHPGAGGRAYPHLTVGPRDAASPAFRLDRHERAVVLSECDDSGTWTLGWFGCLADALAMLHREVLARPDGADDPAPIQRAVPA